MENFADPKQPKDPRKNKHRIEETFDQNQNIK